MIIDEQHPDYPEFQRKLHALYEEFGRIEEAERAKYPNWHGHDHPSEKVLHPIRKKYNARAKALMKEYAYLYKPDNEPPEE